MGWFRRNEHDEEQLSAYLDGELDARSAEKIEQHLAVCDSCTALLEELRETRALLSALPHQTPPRSFVLGAEHARAPVREVAPPKRWSMALAPAVALSVFVALIVVDMGSYSSTSSDESTESFTAATSRQASGDDALQQEAAGGAGAATAVDDADASADGANSGAGGPAQDPVAPEAAAGAAEAGTGPAASPEAPPAAMSAEAVASPAEGETALGTAGSSAEEAGPSPEPITLEAPKATDGDGGISTLRILQVVAGAVFLASGFYVFVWPRLSRGGS